jgi:hypothetical protein
MESYFVNLFHEIGSQSRVDRPTLDAAEFPGCYGSGAERMAFASRSSDRVEHPIFDTA